MADEISEAPAGLDEFLAAPNTAPQQPPTSDAPPGLNEFIAPEMQQEKYGTPGQQALSGLEGAAKGVAGPLATGAERLLGIPEEDIRGRAEANPWTHGLGEAAGLVGGAVSGTGLGGVMGKVGEIGSAALGLGKVGSSIAKHAIENLVFQGSDEASKLILNDPNQSADTAMADMGLAGLIGGAFGTVAPLWNATMGGKTSGMLKALADKVGGVEGAVPNAINDAITKSGLEMAPEVKAGLSQDPKVQEMFKTLQQSDTTSSGKALQKSYDTFRKDAGDTIVNALGKSPEEVASMGDLSKAEHGKNVGMTLAKEYSAQADPIAQVFDDLKTKFKNVELPQELVTAAGDKIPSTVDNAIEKISQLAIDEGWAASPSSDIMREVDRTIKELPLQKNLKNLGDYITQVGNNTSKDPLNGSLKRAGQMINSVLKDAEAEVIGSKLGAEEGPGALESFQNARKAYAAQSVLKNALDDRLHIGGSTSGFGKRLIEMAKTDSETMLRRLSGVNDAHLLGFLQKTYPETANALRDYHVSDLLKTASDKAKPGMTINSEALLSRLGKMQPELKNFIASPEALQKVEAVSNIIDEFNKLPHNFSNTARTADKLMQHIPGVVVGAATMIHGAHWATAALTGALAKVIGKDAPDAIRLGLLKFLGSDKPISSQGFKSMVEYAQHTMRGETMLTKGVGNLFKAGAEVLPASQMPTDKDRSKINKAIDDLNQSPEKMLDLAGKTGHYLPDHATSLSQTAANAVKFISANRPNTAPQSPLDSKRQMNSVEKAKYNKMLDIAQQPLMILKHIADGKLTPEDVNIQKTLYPALYSRTVDKITSEMAKAQAKGTVIPYRTRMGLSIYTGQPLDSTMKPAAIMSAQSVGQDQQQPQQADQGGQTAPNKSTSGLNKMSNMYKTQGQSAEEDRSGRRK